MRDNSNDFIYEGNNYFSDEENGNYINLDNLQMLEEGIDDYINKESLNNIDEENIYDINNKDKNNEEEKKDDEVFTLNNQIQTLKNLLNEKRDEIDKMNNEKNVLKLSLLQIQEEMYHKNQEFQLQINNLEEKVNTSNLIKEKYEKKNEELKNVINQLKNKNNKKLLNNYLELSSIGNTEFNRNKIMIENRNLMEEIKNLKEKQGNEINILTNVHQAEINNYQKEIESLNLKLNDLIINKPNHNLINEENSNYQLEKKIYEYKKTISNIKSDNLNLQKLVKKYKKQTEELKLVIEETEKKITQLKIDYGDIISELKNEIIILQQSKKERNK